MVVKLAALFIVVPIIEIVLLLQLGQWIDVLPTIALILTTGIVGASLAKAQGARVLATIKGRLAKGEVPGDDLVDGFLILVAGILLVTPGLLTDVTGISLLVPWTRAVVRRRLKVYFTRQLAEGKWAVAPMNLGGPPFARGDVIDIEPEDDPSKLMKH